MGDASAGRVRAAARLAVYLGDTRVQEVDLGVEPLRIGRGDQNDVVLEDPEMAVSRFHAEVRFDGRRYVLRDLNSQNGTWLGEKRVDRVELRAGVPVTIGPYRLVLDPVRGSEG